MAPLGSEHRDWRRPINTIRPTAGLQRTSTTADYTPTTEPHHTRCNGRTAYSMNNDTTPMVVNWTRRQHDGVLKHTNRQQHTQIAANHIQRLSHPCTIVGTWAAMAHFWQNTKYDTQTTSDAATRARSDNKVHEPGRHEPAACDVDARNSLQYRHIDGTCLRRSCNHQARDI
jgi:hypothetical protein